MAKTIGLLARLGYVVVLDEFQYFHRKILSDFTSYLQREVDALAADGGKVKGGLFVLGSIHTELTSLLEDRNAPLYNRTTDVVDVGHLDVASILELLREHTEASPARLLTLWNLFEGVPKFYRDCYEQGVLAAPRSELLRRMFFQSSAPLRNEAENWFLHELRGRYDVVLNFIARNPGCSSADLDAYVRHVSPEMAEQTAGYVKILTDRYELVERRLPIFATKKERKGRYYIRDNFLRSWLSALAAPTAAINFRPVGSLVEQALSRLDESEGHGFERLVSSLYQERSRKGLPGFSLTHEISGYWDNEGIELDLVAVDDQNRRIRFANCKRSASKLLPSLEATNRHIERFLALRPHPGYGVEKVAIAPQVSKELEQNIRKRGWLVEDLARLTADL
ncbi:MAG: DUF234 domain-containing protein [Deltaproteobacteria bacterium]|nr:DUF234 domain-containing protein [Deltaproteobacteria bacterium]